MGLSEKKESLSRLHLIDLLLKNAPGDDRRLRSTHPAVDELLAKAATDSDGRAPLPIDEPIGYSRFSRAYSRFSRAYSRFSRAYSRFSRA